MANPLLELLRKIRWKLNIVRGKEIEFCVDIEVTKKHLGSEYGGYWVNLDSLSQESVVYSIGIGEDLSFDLDLMNMIGCPVFAFDPTPKSLEWVREKKLPEGITITPWGISDFDDDAEFFPPDNPEHVSHSLIQHDDTQSKGVRVTFRKLASIMKHFEHEVIDLLKMDIEGGEYTVIKDIVSSNINVNQICLEFHHRFSGVGIEHTKEAVENLKTMGFHLFHQDRHCCSFIRRNKEIV